MSGSHASRAFLLRLQHNSVDTRAQPVPYTIGNERLYANRNYLGSFRKGLPTTDGHVDPVVYQKLVQALRTRNFAPLKGIAKGLVDPLGAYYFDDQGPDPTSLPVGVPPPISSLEFARDLEQLYAMALLRDVPFSEYASNSSVSQIASYFQRNPSTLFRELPTVGSGPLVSQLFLDTPFRVLTRKDYLTERAVYDRAHSGNADQKLQEYQPAPRYISNLRDLASWTFYDYSIQAYVECILSLARNHSAALVNPYKDQPYVGFLAFNIPFALDLIGKAGTLALKAAWYQKWLVHRLARPEEIAYEVDRLVSGRTPTYPDQVHAQLLNSPIVKTTMDKQGTALLSQTFSVGAPGHPSFPSGHTAIAGACVTILKGLYNGDYVFPEPKVPSADGKSLLPWTGGPLTMWNELDRLADNIGLGRAASGVHYIFDNRAGLELGERIGLRLLQLAKDNLGSSGVNFTVRKFDGTVVRI